MARMEDLHFRLVQNTILRLIDYGLYDEELVDYNVQENESFLFACVSGLV